MSDLFADEEGKTETLRPLAERLRPKKISEVIGQRQVLAPNAPLGSMLERGTLSSLILWGPTGVGKTTVARLLANHTHLHFEQISAIFSGVSELKKCIERAKLRASTERGKLLFVDEIHRFNKGQQDAFLPSLKDGTIVLVGATKANPSFELNTALFPELRSWY